MFEFDVNKASKIRIFFHNLKFRFYYWFKYDRRYRLSNIPRYLRGFEAFLRFGRVYCPDCNRRAKYLFNPKSTYYDEPMEEWAWFCWLEPNIIWESDLHKLDIHNN